MNEQLTHINISDDEISIKEIVVKFKNWFNYLKTQWFKILIFGIMGGIIGFTYAYFQPINYVAKLSFNVEEGKSSGGGGLASLAGLAGIDIGGMSGNSLIAGDNILMFLKSTSLIRTTLLTSFDSTKNYSLADKYADVYELRGKWQKNKKIGLAVYFPTTQKIKFTRLQDSLIQVLTRKILTKELIIERPEKKATIITVETTMQDELLSKLFCERLVGEATNRYITSKTTRQKTNVDRLERRADSIGKLLNYKTFSTALENEKILDVNPAYRSTTVNAEVIGRDKLMLGTIYGEIVKNLELGKVQLTQETPSIQILDGVQEPLNLIKISKLLYTFVYSIGSIFLFSAISIIKKFYR